MIENGIGAADSPQAAEIKDIGRQLAAKSTEHDRLASLGSHLQSGSATSLHHALRYIVYFVHMWKSGKFTGYRDEKKGPVYFVHFVHFSRKYFGSRARPLPKRVSVPPCLRGERVHWDSSKVIVLRIGHAK
jgi:hypothetical protein